MIMGAAQYVIYTINTGQLGYSPRIKNQKYAYFVSVVGFISCVLLSWVAAICDNDNAESCRGNGTIHSICAVTFFIGYNFMMASSSFSKSSDCVSLHHICSLLSVLLKLRFVNPVSDLLVSKSSLWGDQTPLAIVEWTDVGLILVWTVSFLISNSPKV